MKRLSAPYGDCIDDGRTTSYIYENYDYTTEGCFRSCFQQLVMAECECGDPRYPVLEGQEHCQAADPLARECLNSMVKQLANVQNSVR